MMRYRKNKLMRMIGAQTLSDYDFNGTLEDDFNKIADANNIPAAFRNMDSLRRLFIDIYLLGGIRGVQKERRKNNTHLLKNEKAELISLINSIDSERTLKLIHGAAVALMK